MKLETHERSRASPRWSYEPHIVIYRMALSTCRAICCSSFFLNPIQSNPFHSSISFSIAIYHINAHTYTNI